LSGALDAGLTDLASASLCNTITFLPASQSLPIANASTTAVFVDEFNAGFF
jgi:hypothetical protein